MGEVQSPRNVHRTTPDPSSLTTVKGYADKLTLYLCKASAYWQVRYFCNGREFRKSTRFTNTKDAIEFAKRFYDDINLRQHTGQRNRKRELFEHQAMEFMTLQESRCLRGDITRSTFQNALD